MRIALLGTRGVPARYGGFETAVEEIGRRLVLRGHEVTVYCRSEDRSPEYLGMRRVVLPAVRSKVAETLSHTALSVAHQVRNRADVAVVFNAANAPLLPALRALGIPVAVHVDGLEWQRGKWGPVGRRYYLLAERAAVRWADALIADAAGIQAYYRRRYGAQSHLLTYGAPVLEAPALHRLPELGLQPQGYHLVVARLEPENHVDLILRGYLASSAQQPLVVVGSAPYASAHVSELERLAGADDRVRMLGAVWDQELLDALYAGASCYLHGHSVGGTNPSLLRALGAGASAAAFDVDFNREVIGDAGVFFAEEDDVTTVLKQVETDPAGARARGEAGRRSVAQRYRWDDVALGYEELCRLLATGTTTRDDHRDDHRAGHGIDGRAGRGGEAEVTAPVQAGQGQATPAPETLRATVARLSAAQKSSKGAPAYSRFVNRPLGRVLAALAYRLDLTPNAVSAISAVLTFSGIAVVAVVRPSAATAVLVVALLAGGYAFDAADGQLARLRGGGSLSGEWLDHMIDAAKVSSLHIAVAIAVHRFFGVPEAWVLVPLGFAVVGAVFFFGMILNDQLRRQRGGGARAAAPATSAFRSLAALPTDYGVLCVSFLLLGLPRAFLACYTVLFVGTAGYLALALVKWFREIRALDAEVGS